MSKEYLPLLALGVTGNSVTGILFRWDGLATRLVFGMLETHPFGRLVDTRATLSLGGDPANCDNVLCASSV